MIDAMSDLVAAEVRDDLAAALMDAGPPRGKPSGKLVFPYCSDKAVPRRTRGGTEVAGEYREGT